jgi:hypothetical protein
LRSYGSRIYWLKGALVIYLLFLACNENVIVEGKDTDTEDVQTDSGNPPDTDDTDDTDDTEVEELPKPSEMIYLHTKSQLYSYSYDSEGFSGVGTFTLPDGNQPNITDIAINSWGDFYAVSTSTLYKVNPENAQLVYVSELSVPLFGLAFDQFDTLYGVGNGLFIVNTESNTLIPIELDTTINNPGDLIGLPDGSLMCFMENPDDVGDIVIQVEPQTGTSQPILTSEYEELWGVAYTMDIVMAFSTSSDLILIDLYEGTITTTEIEIANIWGASGNPLYTQ